MIPSRPRSRWVPWCACLLASGVASIPTRTQADAPAPYPVSIRIADPRGMHVRYTRAPSTTTTWPPEPSGTADLTAQAQAAYGAAAARMFRAADAAGSDLELAVSIAAADVDSRSSGSTALVEHDVVLRTRAGELLGDWRVRGEHSFVATGEGSLETAFARAARDAAETFEARFEEPEGVASWFRERRIAPRAKAFRVESRAEAPWPERRLGGFVELSGSRVSSLYSADTHWENSSESFAVGVRVGFGTARLRGALAYSTWSSTFAGRYAEGTYHARSNALGVELGPRLLTHSGLEAHGGVGLHYLSTKVDYQGWPSYVGASDADESQFVGSAFAALGYSRCIGAAGWCFGGGVELRRYLGATMESLPIDVARLSFGAFLSAEARFATERARGAPSGAVTR